MNKEMRSRIKKMVQTVRSVLMKEARETLEGVYGLHADGSFEGVQALPELKDLKKSETRRHLEHFFAEEAKTGLKGKEAVDKLVKEIAFTHLNRFVAFKMMEARKIIRQTISRGVDSNAFKFYLVEHSEDERLYNAGKIDETYEKFLLWQSGEIAKGIKVLFDPVNMASQIFPRPRVLKEVLEIINNDTLADIWQEDESIGWVYQYFIEEDKAAVFDKIYTQKKKMDLRDIPSATQIFTPKWIVQYLVENTLGRLWLRMHPDSKINEKMSYYVPNEQDRNGIPIKRISDITFLDPACGTMHFGMVGFDLFYEMYLEEIENAGKDGWPQKPSIPNVAEIPKCIVENNLYGIDLDLRAIQLSALSLYIKAKSKNKDTVMERLNLTHTDIPPFSERAINEFVDSIETSHPVTKKLLRQILPVLNKAYYLGSLLKIETVLNEFVEREKVAFKPFKQGELFDFGGAKQEALDLYVERKVIWEEVKKEITEAFQQFVTTHHEAAGEFVASESIKGLGLIDALIKKHDVVVCNPPFSGRRNWTPELRDDLRMLYLEAANDLYSCFINRCIDLTDQHGFTGMINIHSFMFTSSFENLRKLIINDTSIETMVHLGPTFMELSNPYAQQCTMYVLRNEKPSIDSKGIYFRMIKYINEEKELMLNNALQDYLANKETFSNPHVFILEQEKLKAIPGWPVIYWVSDGIRASFENNPKLGDYFPVKEGINTGDNFRFVKYWWEIGALKPPFMPFIKEGRTTRFYDEIPCIIKWNEGEIRTLSGSAIRNKSYSYRRAVTFLSLTVKGFTTKFTPEGALFCSTGGRSIFPNTDEEQFYLLGLTNSQLITYLLLILNPTVSFTVGDVANIPFISNGSLKKEISEYARNAYILKRRLVDLFETSRDFKICSDWENGIYTALSIEQELAKLETKISEITFKLYGIIESDIKAIQEVLHTLPGKLLKMDDINDPCLKAIDRLYLEKHVPDEVIQKAAGIIEEDYAEEANPEEESTKGKGRQKRFLTFEELCLASGFHPDTVYQYIVENGLEREEERYELAVNWVSYAMGVILDRFKPGVKGELGSGIDEDGNIMLNVNFEKLNTLASENGFMVLDAGHPDDLPTRVETALTLLLGEGECKNLIRIIGRDMRKFLEREFFVKWHIPQYRKRPIYWLLQTSKKSYGIYLFHERLTADTLFLIQERYVNPKIQLEWTRLSEFKDRRDMLPEGRDKRVIEKEIDKIEGLIDELTEFQKRLKATTDMGYDPDIDDGVILNMAPLHELIPWAEPKKFWEELEKGRYDWAHLAMKYWPDRVKERCLKDKSLAIAHRFEQ